MSTEDEVREKHAEHQLITKKKKDEGDDDIPKDELALHAEKARTL